jgi:protein-tyrosine phosphatase
MPSGRASRSKEPTSTSTRERRRQTSSLRRTRSSSAKLHSGIVDVAKKLLDTVHKLDNTNNNSRDGGSPMMIGGGERSARGRKSAAAAAQFFSQAADKKELPNEEEEEDEEEDAHMEGQTPTHINNDNNAKKMMLKTNRTVEGTPKDEKQVERVVSLMRLILTAKKVKEDKVPALIAPNLYLGSIGAAQSEEQIKEKGITHVLTVARGFDIKCVDGVKYMTVEVADSPDADIRSHFPQCFEFISGAVKSGGNVLVHCFAGRSRSASVCAAYVMCHENIRLEEALMRMRLARPQINPNAGFMAQLNQLDEDLVKWRCKTGQEKMKDDEQEVTSAQSQNRNSEESKSSTSESYSMSHDHNNNNNNNNNANTTPRHRRRGVAETDSEKNENKNKRKTTPNSKSSDNNSSDQDNSTPYHGNYGGKNAQQQQQQLREQRAAAVGKTRANSSSGSGGSGEGVVFAAGAGRGGGGSRRGGMMGTATNDKNNNAPRAGEDMVVDMDES